MIVTVEAKKHMKYEESTTWYNKRSSPKHTLFNGMMRQMLS